MVLSLQGSVWLTQGEWMTWTTPQAHAVAESWLQEMGDRWRHVQAVGRSSEELMARGFDISAAVVMAAWLHDVGYADSVVTTGFHPVDGANWLEGLGVPPGVVALVAHHSEARFEAEERGPAASSSRTSRSRNHIGC